jgi:hypothetical protein
MIICENKYVMLNTIIIDNQEYIEVMGYILKDGDWVDYSIVLADIEKVLAEKRTT